MKYKVVNEEEEWEWRPRFRSREEAQDWINGLTAVITVFDDSADEVQHFDSGTCRFVEELKVVPVTKKAVP